MLVQCVHIGGYIEKAVLVYMCTASAAACVHRIGRTDRVVESDFLMDFPMDFLMEKNKFSAFYFLPTRFVVRRRLKIYLTTGRHDLKASRQEEVQSESTATNGAAQTESTATNEAARSESTAAKGKYNPKAQPPTERHELKTPPPAGKHSRQRSGTN